MDRCASRAVRIANFGFALRDPARQLLGSQLFEAFAWLSLRSVADMSRRWFDFEVSFITVRDFVRRLFMSFVASG